jgi:hypothetical protein
MAHHCGAAFLIMPLAGRTAGGWAAASDGGNIEIKIAA